MKRYLLDSEGNVANVIELDDGAVWTPPDGFTLAAPNFTPPVPEPEPEEPDADGALRAVMGDLGTDFADFSRQAPWFPWCVIAGDATEIETAIGGTTVSDANKATVLAALRSNRVLPPA